MEHEKVLLTREGVEKLQEELKYLKEVVRDEIKEELRDARAQGDLSENAEYDAARDRQAQVEVNDEMIPHYQCLYSSLFLSHRVYYMYNSLKTQRIQTLYFLYIQSKSQLRLAFCY